MLCCRFEPEVVEDSDEERVLRKKALQVSDAPPLRRARCVQFLSSCDFTYSKINELQERRKKRRQKKFDARPPCAWF